jgi:hypothetical protein
MSTASNAWKKSRRSSVRTKTDGKKRIGHEDRTPTAIRSYDRKEGSIDVTRMADNGCREG